jgi:hypothetical protein
MEQDFPMKKSKARMVKNKARRNMAEPKEIKNARNSQCFL